MTLLTLLMAPGFALANMSRSTARFDPVQLLALNRRHLHGYLRL